MNSVNSKIAKSFTNIVIFTMVFFVNIRVKAWDIDFSRRQTDFSTVENIKIPAAKEESTADLISKISAQVEPAQDVVILNTEAGFVPEVVKLKKGGNYNLHIVNVNQKDKNISFLMDAFSQSHNTTYGQQKIINITPRADGVFSFQCPETSKQGKVIVVDDSRMPASAPLASKGSTFTSASSDTLVLGARQLKEKSSDPEELPRENSEITVEDLLLPEQKN